MGDLQVLENRSVVDPRDGVRHEVNVSDYVRNIEKEKLEWAPNIVKKRHLSLRGHSKQMSNLGTSLESE